MKARKGFELYNLEEDLGEKTNLASSNKEKLEELKALLAAHAKKLETDQRPAAFVENPKPLSTEGVPTLQKYMGIEDFEVFPERPLGQKK